MTPETSDKKRVLFVDDNRLLRTQTKINLERADHELEVDTASHVSEALNLIEKNEYEAIISDYMMGRRDGLELLKAVRKKNKDLLFIMFTGKGDESVAQDALNMGADRYLRKEGDAQSQYENLAAVLSEEI